ncbi:MAG TPA: hypothetical protein VF666_14275 [Pyrinomonadaceae bacterium]|jgi:hypothetical protein
MADIEVENTLREIRERVRANALDAPPARRAGEASGVSRIEATQTSHVASDALIRLEANLATVERTWNRLPPLLSNRQGWMARLELWVKRKIKRATHWYTWEQVNFNSAVHASLRDSLAALRETLSALREASGALAAHEQRLTQMQSEMNALRQTGAETESRLAAQNTELRNSLASAVENLERAHARQLEQLRRELDNARAQTEAVRQEQLERIQHLTEEQRVSFKQLSLEASENAVLSDRARRRTELRLEEIAKQLEETRKTNS